VKQPRVGIGHKVTGSRADLAETISVITETLLCEVTLRCQVGVVIEPTIVKSSPPEFNQLLIIKYMAPNIYKTKDHLIIEIPLTTTRSNPWMENWHPKMDNVIAVINGFHDQNNNWDEMGFCYRIDMDYADKPDQWTDFFFKWFGEQREFEKLCEELGIEIVYDDGKPTEYQKELLNQAMKKIKKDSPKTFKLLNKN
jgi:hypothetical protein